MSKEFGEPKQSKAEQIVERIVHLSQDRNPEALDRIFDSMSVGLTQSEAEQLSTQVTQLTAAALEQSPDTLAWWCGYIASEINTSADNDREDLPITLLTRKLIDVGLKPFRDFVPYPYQRLLFLNADLFETLPPELKRTMQLLFELDAATDEEVQRINEAIRQELVVYEKKNHDGNE